MGALLEPTASRTTESCHSPWVVNFRERGNRERHGPSSLSIRGQPQVQSHVPGKGIGTPEQGRAENCQTGLSSFVEGGFHAKDRSCSLISICGREALPGDVCNTKQSVYLKDIEPVHLVSS